MCEVPSLWSFVTYFVAFCLFYRFAEHMHEVHGQWTMETPSHVEYMKGEGIFEERQTQKDFYEHTNI